MRREDGPAIRDTIIWFAAFVVSGGLGYLSLGDLVGGAVLPRLWRPLRLVDATAAGTNAAIGTAFKTRWMNDVVYQIACFMILREPTVWRWSHTRHHTDTIIVGRDPEIAAPRPPDVVSAAPQHLRAQEPAYIFARLLLHAIGRLTAEEETFIPEMERRKVYRIARIYLAIFAAVIAACLYFRSILPAMYIGLPTLYGGWFMPLLRPDAACRARRGRARPSAELAHRLHEPDLPVPLLEHELPCRAPHVSDGALSRAAQAARGDQGRLPDALSELDRRLSRDHPGPARQLKEPTYFVRRELPPSAQRGPTSRGKGGIRRRSQRDG